MKERGGLRKKARGLDWRSGGAAGAVLYRIEIDAVDDGPGAQSRAQEACIVGDGPRPAGTGAGGRAGSRLSLLTASATSCDRPPKQATSKLPVLILMALVPRSPPLPCGIFTRPFTANAATMRSRIVL